MAGEGRLDIDELEERLDARAPVRLDVQPDTDAKGRRRTYLRFSWVRPVPETVDLAAARSGGVVGVDLNADHLAATGLDRGLIGSGVGGLNPGALLPVVSGIAALAFL